MNGPKKKKLIYVRHYSQDLSGPSDLDYNNEINRFEKYIHAIKKSHPDFDDDQAYLAFKNSVSSQNIYSIEETE